VLCLNDYPLSREKKQNLLSLIVSYVELSANSWFQFFNRVVFDRQSVDFNRCAKNTFKYGDVFSESHKVIWIEQ